MNSKSLLIYIGAAVIILVGFFLLVRPQSKVPPQQTTQSKTFNLVVKNRKLVSGPETIKVVEGTTVTIKVIVDESEELHLHGYDKSVELVKNKSSSLKFAANITGRFPYEMEHSKTEIGALEVTPK